MDQVLLHACCALSVDLGGQPFAPRSCMRTVALWSDALLSQTRDQGFKSLYSHFLCLQYDRNRSGALEIEELHAVLADLGIMVRFGS